MRIPAIPKPKPLGLVTVGKLAPKDELHFLLHANLAKDILSDAAAMTFILSYLHCRSVSQAAQEAGLSTKDGRALRKRSDVNTALVKITEATVYKYGYDASEIVERTKEFVDIDPICLQNSDGTFRESLEELAPEQRRAIKKFKCKNIYGVDSNGIREVTGKLIEVEFWDKLKAVELLGREKDIFKESRKVTHDITVNMSQTLLDSSKRADEATKAIEYREVEEEED